MSADTLTLAPKILVAIEPSAARKAIEADFCQRGFECRIIRDCASLAEALGAPALYDAAIIGLRFDGQCGLRMARETAALAGDAPVVFHAGERLDDWSVAVAAMKAGAHDVVESPLESAKLDELACRAVDVCTARAQREQLSERPRAEAKNPRNGASPPRPHFRNGAARRREDGGEGADSRAVEAQIEDCLRGHSPSMAAIRRTIADVAKTRATVLIYGESGTGKELVAKAIHRFSRRSDKPFVPVNMAAIPPGLAESFLFGHEKGSFTSADRMQEGCCEAADGGTLFLDEIGEMELQVQPKLLRFLQEGMIQRVGAKSARAVDARIVAATNRDPRSIVRAGQLREDLFFRLHVVPINVPPLRDRPEDILDLAQLFLERSAERHDRPVSSLAEATKEILLQYDWPGNVRQLENMIERLVIFARSEVVEPDEVPAEIHSPSHSDAPTANGAGGAVAAVGESAGEGHRLRRLTSMQRTERSAIIDALQRVDGHVVDAANLLGLGQATVYRKIKQYDIPHQRRRRKRSPK